MGYVKKAAAVAAAGLVLAAAVPTFAEAAGKFQEVVIRNTDSEAVPTKAIGTTPVSGSVAVDGPVSVSGAVSVPDGVTINGTPTVNLAGGSVAVAPPERFVRQLTATGEGGGESCVDLPVPEDKRYLVEAVHLDISTDGEPDVYIRLVRSTGPGATSLLRFTTPLTQRGAAFGSVRMFTGRVEGPFVAHPALESGQFETLSLCARGADTSARGVFVGESSPL